MAHIVCTFHSECLKMNTNLTVILPEQTEMKDCRVIYLLHGLEDNASGWARYTAVERYARERDLAIVIPEVQRSFYTDMAMGLQYFSYVSKELPKMCQRFFGFSKEREKNYIMGLSMGGYGALKCMFHAPKSYAGCAAFSPVTDLPDRVRNAPEDEKKEFQAIFGVDLKVPEREDLFALAKNAKAADFPKIYTACGEGDDLLEQNVRFAELLQTSGFLSTFEHWEGEHNWTFWETAVERGIKLFFDEA